MPDNSELSPQTFDDAIRDHDDAARACGVSIWVGAEPTFTDCRSDAPEWINAATGPEKHARALELAALLARQAPGAAVLRTVGRQYEGEDRPRWNLGLLARRDGKPLWYGPPDPVIAAQAQGEVDLPALRDRLLHALGAAGFICSTVDAACYGVRLIFAEPGTAVAVPVAEALARPSVHNVRTPREGLEDALAATGIGLLILDAEQTPAGAVARVELPAIAGVEQFLRVLGAVSRAGSAAGLAALILWGYPPPVDASLSWTTITPDPGVIEINAAPHATAEAFLADSRRLYAAAAECRLSPWRLHFNGDVADSGGAGQITFGGPAPLESPFFLRPATLPALVRYANRHPCLSYFFAHDHVGSSGQSVRTDECSREYFADLGLAIDLLEHDPAPTPERIWKGLSPFLTDIHGNAHRAELNIEKLFNPNLPGRGKLGLVEFRSMRMAPTPEHSAALVALLRAIVARLASKPYVAPSLDWGPDLHDRFALPFYLRKDLNDVLDDLAASGLALSGPIRRLLMDDEWRVLRRIDLPDAELTVKRAIEFWPLVGDSASQESGASRLIDPSTARIELCLRTHAGSDCARSIRINEYEIPMRFEQNDQGQTGVIGLRYRRFVPLIGLHPSLPAQGPIRLIVSTENGEAHEITIHEWRPDDEAYDGLPTDLDEAARRRRERVTCQQVTCPATSSKPVPSGALTSYCLDLRRLLRP